MSSGFGTTTSDEGFAMPDYDELAELFLGDGGEAPESDARTESEHQFDGIEALILGHLPVRAGPWVGQYAGAVSRQSGHVVGLVRLTDGVVSLDVYGLSDVEIETSGGIGDAIEAAGGFVDRWIVQVQELDEPALACDARVGAVTLLAGANEAAIVAAYRTIKALGTARGDSGAGLPIGVAIMGADEEQAQTAMARLRRASSVFLEREVALAASVSQMQPTVTRSVFRGEATVKASELIGLIHAATEQRETVGGPYPFQGEREDAAVFTAQVGVREEAIDAFEAHANGWHEDAAVAEERAGADGVPDLESLLDGMLPFAARCPDDESVRLAIGTDGTLHLLRRDEDGKGVEPLVAVEAWARKHAKLLAMAAGNGARVDAARSIRRHLFTATPKHVRHLLDTDASVHLLAPVEAGGERVWYCTELN